MLLEVLPSALFIDEGMGTSGPVDEFGCSRKGGGGTVYRVDGSGPPEAFVTFSDKKHSNGLQHYQSTLGA